MSVFRVKKLCFSLAFLSLAVLALAAAAFAQNTPDSATAHTPTSGERAASFLPADSHLPASSPAPAFSGLAAPPELIAPPPAPATPVLASSLMPLPVTQAADDITKVDAVALTDISGEAIGTRNGKDLGAEMWKGSSRAMAETLLGFAAPTASPVLNDLTRRLLTTAATPPAGTGASPQNLTSLRVQKLAAFGAPADAWALATQASPALIDDASLHAIIDITLAGGGADLCGKLQTLVTARPGVDWQKTLILCQIAAKDAKAAQVGLDALRAQPVRDDMFLQIADKLILGTARTLPSQLTPLTPALLGVVRLTGLPVPGELYSHPDTALIPALLALPAKQDVARLTLAEHAAERGLISGDSLGQLYKKIVFAPDALAAPMAASESGSRQRALLYQAALAQTDPVNRVRMAVKFLQVTPPALLNGVGDLLADMMGAIKPDAALTPDALIVAQICMLASKGNDALGWLKLAHLDASNETWQTLWPQFVISGLESADDYTADLVKWSDAVLTPDPASDSKAARDFVITSLLMLDAVGFDAPDSLWAKVMAAPSNEKRVALSPLVRARLQNASLSGRRAESVLLGVALVGGADISLPAALDITRALRATGLRNETALFARQNLALLAGKAN